MRTKDFWHWLNDEGKEIAENAPIGELSKLFASFTQQTLKQKGDKNDKRKN